MVELILSKVYDPRFMFSLLAAVSVAATILSFGLPLLERNARRQRVKAVAIERDRLRAKARETMQRGKNVSLRNQPGAKLRNVVERFDLMKHVGTGDMRAQLRQAGYRGEAPVYVFLAFRLIMPFVTFAAALFYLFAVNSYNLAPVARFGIGLLAAWVGFKLPGIYVSNIIQKRQGSIKKAFPDALDLLLICVEAGMSIETAFRKVSGEMTQASLPLAEELSLTTAELSYLQDRRVAYDNLASRTGLDGVKAVCMALVQSEKYGTSLGTTLRVMAQENRDIRMSEAEKKAAALPPKLTVPMILFFLPVLFVVILGPAGIRVMTTVN